MITKHGRRYTLKSETTGRVLGLARSRKAIMRRKRQVEFFKNLRKSRGGPGSLLEKASPALRRKVLTGKS